MNIKLFVKIQLYENELERLEEAVWHLDDKIE